MVIHTCAIPCFAFLYKIYIQDKKSEKGCNFFALFFVISGKEKFFWRSL